MANDPLVRVRFTAGRMPILKAVEALIYSSRLCGRCRHRGLSKGFVHDLGIAVDQTPDQHKT